MTEFSNGDVIADSNLVVRGSLVSLSNADLRGNVWVPGSLTSYGTTRMYGSLVSFGASTFSNYVTFASNASVLGDMHFDGTIAANSMNISNAIEATSNEVLTLAPLRVGGDATFEGHSTFSNSADFASHVTISGTLEASNLVILSQSMFLDEIHVASGLFMTSNNAVAFFGDALTIASNVIQGVSSIQLSGGDIEIRSNTIHGGALSNASIFTSNLEVQGSLVLQGAFDVAAIKTTSAACNNPAPWLIDGDARERAELSDPRSMALRVFNDTLYPAGSFSILNKDENLLGDQVIASFSVDGTTIRTGDADRLVVNDDGLLVFGSISNVVNLHASNLTLEGGVLSTPPARAAGQAFPDSPEWNTMFGGADSNYIRGDTRLDGVLSMRSGGIAINTQTASNSTGSSHGKISWLSAAQTESAGIDCVFGGYQDHDGVWDNEGSIVFRTTDASNLGAVDRMVIRNNGMVGIGTIDPIYPFHVSGETNGVAIFCTHDIVALSDSRMKTDVEPIRGALDRVSAITGYTYRHVDDDSGRKHCGLIAQELVGVLPEAVHIHPNTGLMTIAYGNVISVLVNAIKELREEVKNGGCRSHVCGDAGSAAV